MSLYNNIEFQCNFLSKIERCVVNQPFPFLSFWVPLKSLKSSSNTSSVARLALGSNVCSWCSTDALSWLWHFALSLDDALVLWVSSLPTFRLKRRWNEERSTPLLKNKFWVVRASLAVWKILFWCWIQSALESSEVPLEEVLILRISFCKGLKSLLYIIILY